MVCVTSLSVPEPQISLSFAVFGQPFLIYGVEAKFIPLPLDPMLILAIGSNGKIRK